MGARAEGAIDLFLATPAGCARRCLVGFEDLAAGVAAAGVFLCRLAGFAAGLLAGFVAAPEVCPGRLAFAGPRRVIGSSSNRGSIKLCGSNAGGDPE